LENSYSFVQDITENSPLHIPEKGQKWLRKPFRSFPKQALIDITPMRAMFDMSKKFRNVFLFVLKNVHFWRLIDEY
jgi:hypothetical protein